MNVLLLMAHSIAEYDDVRMFHDMGVDVFSIGAYTNPWIPGDDKRPPLPQVPYHPDLAALVEGDQMAHKAHLPDALIDWADTIIIHHFLEQWLLPQWKRIAHKRVIWRTCGQSDPRLETAMQPYRRQGLQIVRYSPKEERAFTALHCFAGSDALIRFGKYPEDWHGWDGEWATVGNVTQNMIGRGDSVGYGFWKAATDGLDAMPAGPGSAELPGGVGNLSYDQLQAYLRHIRVMLYTGTQPASYALGLIEAMMTGTPVVSIGPKGMWLPDLFEAPDIVSVWSDDPENVKRTLTGWLNDIDDAREWSHRQRHCAMDLFDVAKVSRQWAQFLGVPVREAVTA